MQDFPLTTTAVLRHGASVHAGSEVVTWEGEGARRTTFAQVADDAARLANALAALGIGEGDRVGTFCWNHAEHLVAYFGIPGSGAVLHTLNIRLFPDQLAYVVGHAEDRVVVVDDSLVPLLARVVDRLDTVERFVVVGDGDASALGDREVLRWSELLAAQEPTYEWPTLDERAAAAMCYTSGTTGDPKGVVYSHRSTFLHSLASTSGANLPLTDRDRALLIVPMFHANAWGLPYSAFMVGADLHMPGRFLQAEPLSRFVAAERPTCSAAVPTIWNDVLRYSDDHAVDLSSLDWIVCGGSAVPRALMEAFDERFGVRIVQAWGMTETSPLGAVGRPPRTVEPGSAEEMDARVRTGRVVAGVEARIVGDDGSVLPWDDDAVGELQVRGPWITAAYHGEETPEKFDDGWLRTGDVGAIDAHGSIRLTDRAKDVIKSGGEWISSVELEGLLMGHPDVAEASVIGVPDDRWGERPLACVVRRGGSTVEPEELAGFLGDKVASWQVPERWAFVDEVPKTSVGKFDKKVLRARHAEGTLPVETTG